MKIVIVGAGNVGTQIAAHCSGKGHKVTLFTSHPEMIHKKIEVIDDNNQVICSGEIDKATNDVKEAFSEVDIIFVTTPANVMQKNANIIYPFVTTNMIIILVPGTGGGEVAFANCIKKGAVVCGMQRVPSVARLVQRGKTVRAIGYRKQLHIASIPQEKRHVCADILESIFDISCVCLPNYLNVTLTPSNPILHTTRLRTIFKNYHNEVYYQSLPLFYEDWDDQSSELLLACDAEVQKICKKLVDFDLSNVKSLRDHYESDSKEALTQKIRSIQGFKGILTPFIATAKGYIPDFESRYFVADFRFGLILFLQIANFVQISVPNMQDTMNWYWQLVDDTDSFSYMKSGIKTYEAFVNFYLR